MDSPDWIKQKKSKSNPTKNDDQYFQCAAIIALNHEKIELHPERVSEIKPFINNYNLEEINYSSNIQDWKKLKKKFISFCQCFAYQTKETFPTCISKINCEKQIIHLMIPNEEKEN